MSVKNSEALLISSGTLNEKKMVNIAEKIEDRKKTRIDDAVHKKAVKEESKVTEEKYSFFTLHFRKEHQLIVEMLKCDDLVDKPKALIVEHFDSILISLQRLQKFFNDSVSFLPKYQSQKAQDQLIELNLTISAKRAEMLPKKKFAFKSKSKKNTANNKENVEVKKENAMDKFAQKAAQYSTQECEVTNKINEEVTLTQSFIFQNDVSVSKLDQCKVYLYGNAGTVHISDVKNSLIVMGPVSGSVFVDRCEDCTIATSCQQLRVHHTTKTDFYLHVTSRAIIEDTNSVQFAPYTIQYLDLQQHYQASGLDQNENNWDKVNDFNWLVMDSQSPNWAIMKPEDRKCNWN